MANLKTITPDRAADLVRSGAVLIDIREAAEHASEHIPGARHHALSQIDAQHPVRAGDTVLIYHCKSGGRTNMNAKRLAAAAGDCEVFLLGGGIEEWKRAGLPTSASPANHKKESHKKESHKKASHKKQSHKKDAARSPGGWISRLAGLFR